MSYNRLFVYRIIFIPFIALFFLSSLITQSKAQPLTYGTFQDTILLQASISGDTATIPVCTEKGVLHTCEVKIPLALIGNTALSKIFLNTRGHDQIYVRRLSSLSNRPNNSLAFFSATTNSNTARIYHVNFIFKALSSYKNVQLYRLVNGTWTPLTTTLLSQEGNVSWYRATSPGFSNFAIVGTEGSNKSNALPFTSGLPIYISGLIGIMFLLSGVIIRLKAK